MQSLPYVDRSALSSDVQQALDTLPDLNLFRLVAHAETAFIPWLRLGGALLSSLSLDPALRELAILQVATLLDAEYEWVQHAEIAVAVGVRPEQVEAIAAGAADSPVFSEGERELLRFTTEVVERRAASEGATAALLRTHPPREVVELLMVIGHYTSVAYLAKTAGIAVDPPARMAVVDVAREQR